MKKLNITWDGITDNTGYLFSFAKSLAAAIKNSPWHENAEDIIATSGFAFRMWVSPDLCPSATSIWSFDQQKAWVENGGFSCSYVGRYWGQDEIEEQKRLEAISIIKNSIDNGIPAVSWDIGVPEWGLITGYDDETQSLITLSIVGKESEMSYNGLGKREIPILSVLTVTGANSKSDAEILRDTIRLAASHLRGDEWCENAKGLEAYTTLIRHFEAAFNHEASCNMEYFLGTYCELKYYAWKYLEKSEQFELATIYMEVYKIWLEAFEIKTGEDISKVDVRERIANLLKNAHEKEIRALEIMNGIISD